MKNETRRMLVCLFACFLSSFLTCLRKPFLSNPREFYGQKQKQKQKQKQRNKQTQILEEINWKLIE